MKVGDIYKLESNLFPAQMNDYSRYCVIRSVSEDTISFSVASDNQEQIGNGIISFNSSAFTIARHDFGEHFTLVPNAVKVSDSH